MMDIVNSNGILTDQLVDEEPSFYKYLDSDEYAEKYRRYEADFRKYLMDKHFSEVDEYEETTTIDGETIWSSVWPCARWYADPDASFVDPPQCIEEEEDDVEEVGEVEEMEEVEEVEEEVEEVGEVEEVEEEQEEVIDSAGEKDGGITAKAGQKRDASAAGLTDEGRPHKTFCLTRDDPDHPDRFSFQYIGDRYLTRDQEAASQLWRNITLPGARAFPDHEELVFQEGYKKFARSSLETNALANDLIAQYDRKLKLKLADRDAFKNLSTTFDQLVLSVEEMKRTISRLEREAETHQAKVGSLNDEVARLGKCESELKGEVTKLQAELIATKEHEEKECARLRNDRAAKVARTTKKAQTRLDKVKTYVKEQEEVVLPKLDALSQAKGSQEIVAVLISRGAVISESELEVLAKETKVAEEEVDALEITELMDTDLNMSPDQLGFGRPRSSTQATPVPDQHCSNSELVGQSGIRHITVDAQDPEA